jgi:hypothetical protein
MSSSKSNAVAEAIRDTLLAHLFENDDDGARRFLPTETALLAEQYHLENGLLAMPAQCPGIWVDESRSTENNDEDCGGGIQADGTILAGYTQDVYNVDIWIWLKGRKAEDMRETMNVWRDGVQACLRAYWHLDDPGRRMSCAPETGQPATDMYGEASATYWAGTVAATVTAQAVIGSATLDPAVV